MSGFGDALSVVANLVSIAVVLGALTLWISGRNPLVVRALRADRRRTVGPVLAATGMSKRAVRRATRTCTRKYVNGDRAPTIQAELDWLDEVAQEFGASTPVAYHGLAGSTVEDSLSALSNGYRGLALRLRGRGLFGGGTSLLIESLAQVCEDLARHLATNATFAAGEPGSSSNLEVVAHQGDAHLEFAHLRAKDAPGVGIDDLAVTYVPRRLVVPDTLSDKIAHLDGITTESLRLSEHERRELDKRFEGKTFDGVLPSLKAARLERDPASGRRRLHCVLAEASFSSVMASHYVGESGVGRRRSDLRSEAGLLTLAILPVTRDGLFVLTTRTEHVSVTTGKVSPAVTGNLEMRDRTGLAVDRDANGLPDPLLALARECREELGLQVVRDRIEILGTLRFASPSEVGTTVLLTTVDLDVELQDVADGSRDADRIEGAWESHEAITGVPVPRNTQERLALLAWTLTNPAHVPHLTGCLVAYCYPLLCADLTVEAANERIVQLAGRTDQAPAPAGIRTVRPETSARALPSWASDVLTEVADLRERIRRHLPTI
jgi:8-oxo-dGTP pyrophosphatase MutT (NUDIX family)